MMNKYRKVIILCTILTAVLLFFSLYAEVRMTISGQGKCFSVAFFETQKMAAADRIVIKGNGKEITITDTEVVRELAEQTTVATHANLGCAEDRQIEVYRGNKLIRSMKWGSCCHAVKVYETDVSHWLFSPTDLENLNRNSGWVFLSNEMVDTLNALLAGK